MDACSPEDEEEIQEDQQDEDRAMAWKRHFTCGDMCRATGCVVFGKPVMDCRREFPRTLTVKSVLQNAFFLKIEGTKITVTCVSCQLRFQR